MFTNDYILDGKATGEVAERLQSVHYDAGLLRPFVDRKNNLCVTVNVGIDPADPTGKKILYKNRKVRDMVWAGEMPQPQVTNATSLRKDEWIRLDQSALLAYRERLKAWSDLVSSASLGGFNAMGKTILEWETQSDPGEAIVDMDGNTGGLGDTPTWQLESVPLPITHSSFWYTSRQLAVSRNIGTPLDTNGAEWAGRRIGEKVEKTTIGIDTGMTYGVTPTGGQASTVFGYTNHPLRNTDITITVPDGSNATTTVTEVLSLLASMANNDFRYGPFMVYNSTDWDQFLDNDYVSSGGNNPNQTLRDRLRKIDEIRDVKRLDFLTNTFTLLLIQMNKDTARAINGMDLTTIQWESNGGTQLNFKSMVIQVPNLRADFSGKSGIMHATTA